MASNALFGLGTGEMAALLYDNANSTSDQLATTVFADIPREEIVALMGSSALAAREFVQPTDGEDYELLPPIKQLRDLFHEAHFWILCNGTRNNEPDALRVLASTTAVAAFQKRAFGTFFGTVVEKEPTNPEPPSVPVLASLKDFMDHCDGEVATLLFTPASPVTTFTGPHEQQLAQLRARLG